MLKKVMLDPGRKVFRAELAVAKVFVHIPMMKRNATFIECPSFARNSTKHFK
jgi:hypothetical protein